MAESVIMESKPSSRLAELYKRIPILIKLMLELSLACLVLIGGPFLLYYLDPNRHLWYSPYDTPPPPERSRMQLGPEVERWATLSFVLLGGFILSRRLSQLVFRVIGHIFRMYKSSLQKESLKFLEMAMTSSRYIFYFFTSLLVWGAVKALFPVPLDPRIALYKAAILAGKKDAKMPKIPVLERPRYFHLDRLAFVGVFYTTCLAIEQAILHSLTLYFGQTIYKERVAQCNYRLWVIKTLRSAYVRGRSHNQPTTASSPRGTQAQYGDKQDNVAAFLMENAGAAQSPREGLSDILFDFYSNPLEDDWENVEEQSSQSSDILTIDQLRGVFSQNELKRAFAVFDPTESGMISRDEYKRALNEIYAERWAILTGVTGHSKMVDQLDSLLKRLIMALTVIFVFFAYGIRMDNLTKILTFLMIPVSRALRTFFSAITYIFTTHPYDVGDRVTISNTHFFVQHVGLLFTQFRRMDGAVVYYPNYLLASLAVNNIKRTPKQSQRFELIFDGESASPGRIGLLRQRIQEALTKSSRDFSHGQTWFLQMPDACSIRLTLVLHHNTNQQEGHPWAMRATHFLDTVREITEDLGLKYRPPIRSLICEEEVSVICVD